MKDAILGRISVSSPPPPHAVSGLPPTQVLPRSLLLPLQSQLRVVAPSLRVTAIVGQDVVLRCHLCPCKDAWNSDIRWIQHQSSGFVHHYQNGVDLEQMEEYKGRTELLRNGLSDGNLDLRITAVRSTDSGSYSCAVENGDGYAEAVVNLEVSDPFSETIYPWKVALGVVVPLLLVAFVVIIAFLYRKQGELRAEEMERREVLLSPANLRTLRSSRVSCGMRCSSHQTLSLLFLCRKNGWRRQRSWKRDGQFGK
uniref:Ig-like domain-containing protein n=1 Tax=Meleagris gallopavo TaxID=9103 RepID=A0A803YMV0_MELGA